jgi:hypothetical protein
LNKIKDKAFVLIALGIGGAVIIGDLGMHFLFGPDDTPVNSAVSIIDKIESKNKIYDTATSLAIGNDPSESHIMRPAGWEGKFANFTKP